MICCRSCTSAQGPARPSLTSKCAPWDLGQYRSPVRLALASVADRLLLSAALGSSAHSNCSQQIWGPASSGLISEHKQLLSSPSQRRQQLQKAMIRPPAPSPLLAPKPEAPDSARRYAQVALQPAACPTQAGLQAGGAAAGGQPEEGGHNGAGCGQGAPRLPWLDLGGRHPARARGHRPAPLPDRHRPSRRWESAAG